MEDQKSFSLAPTESPVPYFQMIGRSQRAFMIDYEIAGNTYTVKSETGLLGGELAQAAMADYEEYHHKIANGFPIVLFLVMDKCFKRKFKVEKYHKIRFHIEELYD